MAGPTATGTVDERTFRDLAGRFVTGVVIVTTTFEGEALGMTANSFTSVCLDPPTVLVCLRAESRTTSAVLSSGRFAISVLRDDQEEVSSRFAKRGAPRFEAEAEGEVLFEDGLPLVRGAIAYFICRITATHRVGDHDVVFGVVERAKGLSGTPLVFHGGRYSELTGRERNADWCWYS